MDVWLQYNLLNPFLYDMMEDFNFVSPSEEEWECTRQATVKPRLQYRRFRA